MVSFSCTLLCTHFDDLGPSPPSPTQGPNLQKGRITRGMLKRIQEGSASQNPLKPNGIKLLFKWANEDIKF